MRAVGAGEPGRDIDVPRSSICLGALPAVPWALLAAGRDGPAAPGALLAGDTEREGLAAPGALLLPAVCVTPAAPGALLVDKVGGTP